MAIKGVIKNSVTADISAEQFASLFQSIYGKNGICNVYEKLQCVKIDNNTVRLSSGVYNLSGYMVMVENGTNEDFVIDSGTAGLKRNDLLIAEFVRNGLGTGIDVLTFRIVKGASVVGAASDPELIAQDISSDGTTRQEALYRIMIDGTNITSVVPLASKIENINTLYPLSESNANGSYVKYADGTMICWNNTIVSGIAVTTAQGALFTSSNLEFSFPQTFISAPTVSLTPRASTLTLFIQQAGSASNVSMIYKVNSATSTSIESLIINWIAIGRWK